MRQLTLLLSLSLCLFTLSEVADNNFSQCKKVFLDKRPPNFTPPAGVQVRPICQCLQDGEGQKIYLYATLYSTTWRIPVYSAYVFNTNKSIGRCDAWYIEPQLDRDPQSRDYEPCMGPQGYSANMGTNQALNRDYADSGYNKGHLCPVLHTNNHLSMLATSTLTNAAPQDPDFNRKAWGAHEAAVLGDMAFCDKEAYVVTGVVPDTNLKINNNVRVAKYYWRAFCCVKDNKYVGVGYYGPDGGKVIEMSVSDLEKKLTDFYKTERVFIFPNQNCQLTIKKRARSD